MAEKKSKKQEKKDKELTETLQRLQAEFENYKKQAEKEKQQYAKYASAVIIKKLLPLLDSFEIALKNCKQKDDFYKGMEIIYAQLITTLEKQGLKPIKTSKFDPYKHEVLMTEESDKEEGVILEEMQKGYMLNDAVLRHSKVKIAKKKAGDKNEANVNDNQAHTVK